MFTGVSRISFISLDTFLNPNPPLPLSMRGFEYTFTRELNSLHRTDRFLLLSSRNRKINEMSQLLFSIAAILAEGADCEKHFGSPQSGSPKSPGTLSSHECEPVEYFDVCVDSCTPDSTGDMCRESCLVMIVGIRECISKCHTSKASERGCSQRCFHSTAWSNYSTTDFIANLCSRDDCDGICRQFNSTTAGATCMGFDANADNTCPSFTVLCDTTTEPSGPVNVKLSLSTTTTTQSIGNTTGVGIDNAPSIDSAGITGITGAILVLLFLAFVTVRRGKRQKLEDADHEVCTLLSF